VLNAENGSVSAQTSALWGVAGDGALRGVVAPGQLVYGDNQYGEDYEDSCDMTMRFQHRVTVGAGSSGLAAGTPVQLAVDLDLTGYLSADSSMYASQEAAETASAFASAEYLVNGVGAEPCESPEGCGPLLRYAASGDRNYYRYPGDDSGGTTYGSLGWSLYSNDGIDDGASREIDGSRDGAGVILPAPFDFGPHTATFWTVVGAELTIDARLSLGATEIGEATAKSVFNHGLTASLIQTAAGGPAGLDISYGDAAPTDELPILFLPADMTIEAAGPDGAKAIYEATAHDTEDGVLTPVCDPASGLTFALGETLVSCSVADLNGNVTEDDFTVTVVDTTAPTLNLPLTIVLQATSPQGAVVNYSVSASDFVDANPAVNCSTPSGTTLPVGAWFISCGAVDASGNASDIENFTVVVKGASAQLEDLLGFIVGQDLPHGTKTSLRVKVEAARVAVTFGATDFACDSLQSLINESTALTGKKLTIAQADRIITDATRIQHVLGCD
jgi:hypothetical protein